MRLFLIIATIVPFVFVTVVTAFLSIAQFREGDDKTAGWLVLTTICVSVAATWVGAMMYDEWDKWVNQ